MQIKYVGTQMKNSITVNEIYSVHYFKYTQKFDFPGESHDFWEFVYIDAGEVTVVAEDKNYVLKQGEAIFHKPNEFHNIATSNKFANSVIVSFSSKSRAVKFFEEKILSLSSYEKELLSRIVEEASNAYPSVMSEVYCEKLPENQSVDFASEQVIRQNLELLLVSLVRNNGDVRKRAPSITSVRQAQSDKTVQRIIEYVKDNLYDDFTLDDIAKELFFSKTYMKSVFRKKMGISIIQYCLELKLDEAKRLISKREYTFTEIAYKLNFASVQYFSRIFKNHTGMTPTEYARSITCEKVLK